MSDAVPTPKQSLRGIITELFPWLPGFVAVASAGGKGLAIRAAGGLLHLAGGPDDPAVHRKGDGIKAYLSITTAMASPTQFTITPTDKNGIPSGPPSPIVLGTTATVIVELGGQSTEGSEKVTCA